MPLTGEICTTATLTPDDIDRMEALMRQYYTGVASAVFRADLAEKPWAVVLRDDDGLLRGFSTICLLEETVDDVHVRAVFSGDTIIDRPHWGALALERAWLAFLSARIDAVPDCRWYWFLICKGYRTYRYLPVYFRHWHPSPAPMPPFEQEVLDRLAERRFGAAYDSATGVIRRRDDYRLRAGIGDITDHERRDPRIAFFAARNPGWVHGDELACLASLARDNFNRCGQRLLGKVAVR